MVRLTAQQMASYWVLPTALQVALLTARPWVRQTALLKAPLMALQLAQLTARGWCSSQCR